MLEIGVRHCHCAFGGVTWTAEQRNQLIKRMEPLTEDNEKLKEAMKLMEKNIQRAQHE